MEYIVVTAVIVAVILGFIALRSRGASSGGTGTPRGPRDTPRDR